MKLGGFAGRILFINLSTGDIRKEPLDTTLAEKFLGGLGICLKLYYDIARPGASPFSAENPIVLGTGPLVGTDLPATSRVYAVTKLAQSKAIGWCGGGGMNFGCMLKNAGYDHVVIEGSADRPVMIKIFDDDVEILDATDLWGKGVKDTCDSLWDRYGRPMGIMTIGQAGENRVIFSMAYIEGGATMGRGGLGAILGSKNLKAIIAKGTKGVGVAKKRRYRAQRDKLLKTMRDYPYLKEWQELGLIKSLPFFPIDLYKKIKKRRLACVSCPIGDKDVVEIKDGPLKGFTTRSTSMINLITPMVYGIKDYRESIKCVSMLDDFGMDMFEFFGVLSFARDLIEQGIISSEQVHDKIEINSLESLETWARKVCLRQGLGDLLADGFNAILNKFGDKARPYAPYIIRGMLPYTGPRGPLVWELFGTMELGQSLDPRGPHVGASGSPTYFARRPLDQFPRHLKRMGAPEDAIKRILPKPDSPEDEDSLKVGRLLTYSHNWFSTLGSLGICARAQINRFYNAETCAEVYSSVTGIETTKEELMIKAERVWNLLRMANVREGFTRQDDTLPDKWFNASPFKNYVTMRPITRQDAEGMLEDYYDERGWDKRTGIPTKEKLRELDLE